MEAPLRRELSWLLEENGWLCEGGPGGPNLLPSRLPALRLGSIRPLWGLPLWCLVWWWLSTIMPRTMLCIMGLLCSRLGRLCIWSACWGRGETAG